MEVTYDTPQGIGFIFDDGTIASLYDLTLIVNGVDAPPSQENDTEDLETATIALRHDATGKVYSLPAWEDMGEESVLIAEMYSPT